MGLRRRSDRIDAPLLFDGSINGESFLAYVEQMLVPTLKPGDIVVTDNRGSHKGHSLRRAIRGAGARPSYRGCRHSGMIYKE